jgi:acetyltransferase-like isoleucine patch superfamily enzyme
MRIGRIPYKLPRIYGQADMVEIGAFVSFAKGVTILSCRDHRSDWVSTFPFRDLWGVGNDGHPTGKGKVVIGNDVWVGFGAIILSGVTIGDGAIIGAGSVVAGNIRPYAVAAGNPAVEIRQRFDYLTVEKLLALKWWDWPDEKIKEHAEVLMSNPEVFFNAL